MVRVSRAVMSVVILPAGFKRVGKYCGGMPLWSQNWEDGKLEANVDYRTKRTELES